MEAEKIVCNKLLDLLCLSIHELLNRNVFGNVKNVKKEQVWHPV